MPWHQTDSLVPIAIAPDSGAGQDGGTIADMLTVPVLRERLHQTPSYPGPYSPRLRRVELFALRGCVHRNPMRLCRFGQREDQFEHPMRRVQAWMPDACLG